MSRHEGPTHTSAPPKLPATLRLGAVHLTVSDLDRSVDFYEDAIGLRLHHREDGVAAMGVGEEDLLVLYEDRGARRAGRHAGLYHYALLFPSREELAHSALRLAATQTPIQGASDHGTHEAIYLPDPDGNGIELAADRPRERWPKPLTYTGGPHPLDLDDVLTTVAGDEPRGEAGSGLVVGHVHLHVGELERGLGFYRDVLGFELMTFMPGAAAFVSAGGYHHHLGFNIWRGEGVPPVPEGRFLPVSNACRVGEQSAVVWKRLYLRPLAARRSAAGVEHGPPNALEAPKPTSSSSTTSTFGAPSGGRRGSIGGNDVSGSFASYVTRPVYGRSGMGRTSR